MYRFTEKDEQIAESILCKICKNLFKDPIQLPCSENICNSHLNDFIKVDEANHKTYFDCCFCNRQHPIHKGFEFSPNKSLSVFCTFHKNDGYTELYNECKRMNELLTKVIDFHKTFEAEQENDLNEYFSDLRSKVDLKREEMILEIHTLSDDLMKEINELENDYLGKLKGIHSDIYLEELNVKIENFEDELNEYLIDLNQWTQINEELKQDLSKLNQIREDSYKLVLSKNDIKFIESTSDKDLEYLFGQITKVLDKRRLISGSNDSSIKIWDVDIGECIKTIDAHEDAVYCLELLDKDKFASGSLDKTIKIWNSKTFEFLKTLNGHSGGVICLKKINENEMMSGSKDSTINIWDLNSGNCVKTLLGHDWSVTGLEITNDKKIISCSNDKTIKIWSYENGECLRTLYGHLNCVSCLILMNNKIISGSTDKKIKIWNIDSGECLDTLNNGSVYSIKPFKENQFISGSYFGNIKLWEIESGFCLTNNKPDHCSIHALEVYEDGKIFSCSSDGSIKILDIESGVCLETFTGHLDTVLSLIYIS